MAEIQIGSVSLASESGGTVTLDSSVDIKGCLNATGSAPVYACRAWVNFNGTGTVAIRDSGNVSSITDNGTGDYTVNFATAMPDANFVGVIGGNRSSGNTGFQTIVDTKATANCRIKTYDVSSSADWDNVDLSIFR